MTRAMVISLVMVVQLVAARAIESAAAENGNLLLHARGRTVAKEADGTSRLVATEKTIEWDPKKTALIICDMWDDHWCRAPRGAWRNWPCP